MRARLRRAARALLMALAIPCALLTMALMLTRNHLGDPDEQEAPQ